MNNPLQSLPLERVARALTPGTSPESQNIWNLYVEVFWWGLLFGVAQAFLPVFTLRAGGTNIHVGLLSALPALVSTLFSIPASRLVEREKKPLNVLLISAFLNRFGYFAVGLLPMLVAASSQANLIVAFVGLLSIANAVALVAFTTMFGRAVPPHARPHVISTRNVLVGIAGIGAAFFGGKFLEVIEYPFNYALLFSIAFAASLLSNYYLGRIRLPPIESKAGAVIPKALNSSQIVSILRANRRYVHFSLSQFIFHWGVFFAVPLYSIYWVLTLGAGEAWIGTFRMVESATSIIAFPLWARYTMRHGNRRTLFLASIGMTCYTIITPFIPSPEWIALLSILGGGASSGFSLALFNELLHVSPEQHRSIFAAVFNTTINFAAFLAPLVSTSIIAITPFFAIQTVLLLAAAFRALGVFAIWRGLETKTTG